MMTATLALLILGTVPVLLASDGLGTQLPAGNTVATARADSQPVSIPVQQPASYQRAISPAHAHKAPAQGW